MKNSNSKNILLLDDSAAMLHELAEVLSAAGFTPLKAQTVELAEKILLEHNVSFAVVDLFLLGDSGSELSNEFICKHLGEIPYVRLTSAPSLVPEEFSGRGIIAKQDFVYCPDLLLDLIN